VESGFEWSWSTPSGTPSTGTGRRHADKIVVRNKDATALSALQKRRDEREREREREREGESTVIKLNSVERYVIRTERPSHSGSSSRTHATKGAFHSHPPTPLVLPEIAGSLLF